MTGTKEPDAEADRGPLHRRPWLASYAPGVPTDVDIPTGSLHEMLADSARRYAGRAALDFFGAQTSYADLADQVSLAAEALHALGVRHGDRVALVLPNCPQHIVAFYA
ncbi:MAG TPA: AMP-binding protein, partial [Candidatus Lustribacter sp.]|nr:AMP-binding protein [Candidatus Lustribacter sp.]